MHCSGCCFCLNIEIIHNLLITMIAVALTTKLLLLLGLLLLVMPEWITVIWVPPNSSPLVDLTLLHAGHHSTRAPWLEHGPPWSTMVHHVFSKLPVARMVFDAFFSCQGPLASSKRRKSKIVSVFSTRPGAV